MAGNVLDFKQKKDKISVPHKIKLCNVIAIYVLHLLPLINPVHTTKIYVPELKHLTSHIPKKLQIFIGTNITSNKSPEGRIPIRHSQHRQTLKTLVKTVKFPHSWAVFLMVSRPALCA